MLGNGVRMVVRSVAGARAVAVAFSAIVLTAALAIALAKDDFANGYAWATTSGGHLVVFAGFERLDPSGDSHVDIEFFQDEVTLDEQPPCNDPGADATPCSFLGTRTAGDIVVSMDFLNGGGFGTLSIREWSGTAYVAVATLTGEGCNGADTICGFNNGGLIDGGPWPNYDRHGMERALAPRHSCHDARV